MKNTIIILLLTLIIKTTYAQIYTGIQAQVFGVNVGNNNVTPEGGIGLSLNGGYSFLNKKLDLGLEVEFMRTIGVENYNFFNFESQYKPFKFKYIKPFIGFKTTYYKIIYKKDFGDIEPLKGFNFSPTIGFQFHSDLLDGLFIDLEYNFKKINHSLYQSTFHICSIGVKYYFNFMKNKKE